MFEFKWLTGAKAMELQLFAEGDNSDADQGGASDGGDNGGGDPTGGDPQGGAGGESQKQPFAVFPDEASFMSRVGRESKKQLKEMLKGFGLDDEKALKSIIDSHKENIEKSKTELEKEREKATALQTERDKALERANSVLRTTEAKLQAVTLGVKPEKVDYLLRLADISDVEVDDKGQVDSAALKAKLESVLTDLPELKGKTTAPSKGGNQFSGDPDKKLLTMDVIRNMSTKEAEERMDEIMEFLSKNK